MTVEQVTRGLRVAHGLRRARRPSEGGLKPGDLIVARQRPARSQGKSSDAGDDADQGPGGHAGDADRASRRQARRATCSSSAREVDVPVVESEMSDAGGKKIALRARSPSFTSGAHGEVARRGAQAARARAPRASCSTCATTAAACSTRPCSSPRSSSPTGTIVSTEGRARPEHVYNADRRRDLAQDPGRRARRPRHRVGVGDRHRRAAGPPPRRRSSARARSARASSRRSSSSPTAARSTSPSASTSRPAGATSAAAASSTGAGITPDVKAQRQPARPSATRRSTSPCAPARRAGSA